MALRKVRTNLDRLFDKSLTDLIRGIRNNKDNEARYIASCIEEIKMELKQDSTYVKANAIEKLAYLQMLGYDISWASFNIIEVMVSTKYTEKRVGYLAASQSFHENTDVLMLTTNLIRKDLTSSNMYDSGVALGGLSCFVTTDLARDLLPDIVNLLTSTRPYTRKRAVLLLYKVFLRYPDALRPTFPRLKERLEDPDPGVQSAVVNVICELARKNPKNYLTLAPVFFKLMTTSSNNWMLIKIIKLFGALVPLEPRLGKKLLEPLTSLINSTSAMSLLYECINTVIAVLISVSASAPGDQTASIQLCVQKLGVLIEDSDQNLKYLGLLAMGKILLTHPKAVQAHKEIVLRCLDDKDESIRLRALDLLYGMVSKKNIMEIVRKLMEHVENAEGSHYRDELLSRIISICSYSNYQYITNFEWYISVLVELTKVEGTKHGTKIADQIQDVTVRVESIRHFSVSQMVLLVENAELLLAGSACQRSNVSEVLLAAAWICGEYSQHVRNKPSVLDAMLRAKVASMNGHILSVYVQGIAKLYSVLMVKAEEENDWDTVDSLDNLLLSKLPNFEVAEHLEAQQRACTLSALIRVVEGEHSERKKIGHEVAKLFEGELNPVAPKAQRKVPVPEGLNLDSWIGSPWPESDEELEDEEKEDGVADVFGMPSSRFSQRFDYKSNGDEENSYKKSKKKESKVKEMSEEEMESRRRAREAERERNPYYVKGTAAAPMKRPTKISSHIEVESHKVETIQSPLEIPGVVGLSRYMEQQDSTLSWKKAKKEKEAVVGSGKKARKMKGKGGKKKETCLPCVSSSSDDEANIIHRVNREEGEMPLDAKSTDGEDNDRNGLTDEFKALDINLEDVILGVPHELKKASPAETRMASLASSSLLHQPASSPRTKKKAKKGNAEEGTKKKVKKTKDSGKSKKTEKIGEQNLLDIDQWLEVSSGAAEGSSNEKARKKKKGEARVKERRSTADYEETSGVCTPSNPLLDSSGSPPCDLAPRLLASNEFLCIELLSVEWREAALRVLLRLRNSGSATLRRAELSFCDAPGLRVTAESELILTGLGHGEAATLLVVLQGETDVDSYKLRGCLSFIREEDDDMGVCEEQLKVVLPISTFCFLQRADLSSEAYSVLLSKEEVSSAAHESVQSRLPLRAILTLISANAHFSVVEEESCAASLYAVTIYSHPLCLLVKKNGTNVSIAVKAGDQAVAEAVVCDLRLLIGRHSS